MADGADQPEVGLIGQTYFYEFMEVVRENYPYGVWMKITEDVQFARTYSIDRGQLPAIKPLKKMADGIFQLQIDIDDKKQANVELEYGRKGNLEPVMGEITNK